MSRRRRRPDVGAAGAHTRVAWDRRPSAAGGEQDSLAQQGQARSAEYLPFELLIFTRPSMGPEFHRVVSPRVTASRSLVRLSANAVRPGRPSARTAAIQAGSSEESSAPGLHLLLVDPGQC